MNQSQELTIFHERQKLTLKCQNSLHKECPEDGLVKKVNRKFALVGGTAPANST